LERLAVLGVTTVFKVDRDRTVERRAAWMVTLSCGPLSEDSFFRADLATADACFDSLLAHSERKGLSPLA
jgi:hypothetical protein